MWVNKITTNRPRRVKNGEGVVSRKGLRRREKRGVRPKTWDLGKEVDVDHGEGN